MKLLSALTQQPADLLDMIANRVGLGSIASTVAILAAVEKELIEITNALSWPGVALFISMTGGIMFIIKLRYDIKKSKLEAKLIQIKIDAESKELDR